MTPDREAAIEAAKQTSLEQMQKLNAAVGMLHPKEIEAGFDYGFDAGYDAGASASQARVEALESALERIATQDSDIYVMCRTIIDGKDANHYRTASESLNMASQVARAALKDERRDNGK